MKRRTKGSKEFVVGAKGRCLCGAIELEIGFPARWAWHDHSATSRRVHGAAYATYVGCWRSRVRVTKGASHLTRYEEPETRRVRSFCIRCGTPVMYERPHAPQMINIPRAMLEGRTGREPLYHVRIDEMQEWTYKGEQLVPLKGFPGIVWERPKKKKRFDLGEPL